MGNENILNIKKLGTFKYTGFDINFENKGFLRSENMMAFIFGAYNSHDSINSVYI